MQAEAMCLGHDGDALAERGEERVREHLGERLRRQQADRAGPTLREHPCDGMRFVAELRAQPRGSAARFRVSPGRGC